MKHYKFIYDKVFIFGFFNDADNVWVDGALRGLISFRKNWKLRMEQTFDANTNNTTKNCLWLLFIGYQSATTNVYYPQFSQMVSRVIYSDA